MSQPTAERTVIERYSLVCVRHELAVHGCVQGDRQEAKSTSSRGQSGVRARQAVYYKLEVKQGLQFPNFSSPFYKLVHSCLRHSIAHHARSSSEAGLQKSMCIKTLNQPWAIPGFSNYMNILFSCRVAGLGRLSAGAKMAMKPFVKRVFTIFATNASFLRVISNFRI